MEWVYGEKVSPPPKKKKALETIISIVVERYETVQLVLRR